MATIDYIGDTWDVMGVGSSRARDGGVVEVYCHLASTTRGRYQRNGMYPIQMCDYIPSTILDSYGIPYKMPPTDVRSPL